MRHHGLGTRFTLSLAVALVAAPAAWGDCEPWPGEPNPLPTAASRDEMTARFAHLRADELAALALQLEPVAPGDAYRVWLHVACLDPERADARDAVARSAPLHLHEPEVVHQAGEITAAAPDIASAFGRLDNPIVVTSPTRAVDGASRSVAAPPARTSLAPRPAGAARRVAPEESPVAADDLLDQAETLVRQAHFEEALEKAKTARAAIPRTGDQVALRQRHARADVIAGTAEVALGNDAEARASFERAIQTDPSLELDRASTSPKVVRAFDAARAAVSGGAP